MGPPLSIDCHVLCMCDDDLLAAVLIEPCVPNAFCYKKLPLTSAGGGAAEGTVGAKQEGEVGCLLLLELLLELLPP